MRRAAGVSVAVLVSYMVLSVVSLTLGLDVLMEVPLILAGGWLWFLARVVPLVTVNLSAVVTSVVLLAIATGVLHVAARWLRAHLAPQGTPWRPWWTGAALTVVLLLFVTSISSIAAFHQAAWLARAEHVVETRGLFGRMLRSQALSCESPLREAVHAGSFEEIRARRSADPEAWAALEERELTFFEAPDGGVFAAVSVPTDPRELDEHGARLCLPGAKPRGLTAVELPGAFAQLRAGSVPDAGR